MSKRRYTLSEEESKRRSERARSMRDPETGLFRARSSDPEPTKKAKKAETKKAKKVEPKKAEPKKAKKAEPKKAKKAEPKKKRKRRFLFGMLG
ncbi:MAG: hypothetical protein ACPGWS_05465 [Solirubrobacterales bacterium]